MKITVRRPVEIEAAAIRCVMHIRHEGLPSNLFGRSGDTLTLTLDIDRRRVRDWPDGQTARIHLKVVDEGSYYLLDRDDNELAIRDNEYVPGCVPGRDGDYFIATIGPGGVIEGWRPDADEIRESFFPDSD